MYNDFFFLNNRVIRALDADWLKDVVYQIVYNVYDAKLLVYCSNYVGNQFIIAIRFLGFVVYGQYTTAKGCILAHHVAS